MTNTNTRVWIVPANDLEAKAIIAILKREGETVLTTSQAWGASWENLEKSIKAHNLNGNPRSQPKRIHEYFALVDIR